MLGIACSVLILKQILKCVYIPWDAVVVYEASQNVYSKQSLDTTLF